MSQEFNITPSRPLVGRHDTWLLLTTSQFSTTPPKSTTIFDTQQLILAEYDTSVKQLTPSQESPYIPHIPVYYFTRISSSYDDHTSTGYKQQQLVSISSSNNTYQLHSSQLLLLFMVINQQGSSMCLACTHYTCTCVPLRLCSLLIKWQYLVQLYSKNTFSPAH